MHQFKRLGDMHILQYTDILSESVDGTTAKTA